MKSGNIKFLRASSRGRCLVSCTRSAPRVVFLVLVLLIDGWFAVPNMGRANVHERCPSSVIELPLCEHGQLVNWQPFVTANGTLGGEGFPQCVTTKIGRIGLKIESVRVKVGRVRIQASKDAWEGGGMTQTLNGDGRRVTIRAELAVEYHSPSDRRNLAGGLFELLVGGAVIARHNVGPILTGTIHSTSIEGQTTLPEGAYTLSIRIRRPFLSLPGTPAPYQYVRRVEIIDSSVLKCPQEER